MIEDRKIFTYEVNENDLKHNNTDKLLGIIDRLREDGSRYRNSLRIICTVYNDMPDELHTIPKFRRFIRKVASLRPYFLYYICLDLESPVHVLGCLGDAETVVTGELVTMREIEERKLTQLDFPLVPTVIHFDEDMYQKMLASIQKLCTEISDPDAESELLELLHEHRPISRI